MFSLFRKKEVIPQVLIAYKWRFPESIKVSIKQSQEGGYIAYVDNFPGCMTQAETGQELFEMVNDALYTYLEIPKEYQPYMQTFFPPKELRDKLSIKIPEKYFREGFVLQGT